jgi:hypothetical protein
MVSSLFDSHSKEETSMLEVAGEEGKELEEQKDKIFNSYKPMLPQGKGGEPRRHVR